MNIFIINPNSDPEMTQVIRQKAQNFASGDFEVECQRVTEAPSFIETYEDEIKSAPGMIKRLRENESYFHAFIVACHCDPNLDLLKEISTKPVLGIGEASMKIATLLGHRFSILSTTPHSIPNKEALVRKYHLQDSLASIRVPGKEKRQNQSRDSYLHAARKAMKEDGAEVIVLGCAGMTDLDKFLEKNTGVPVLDGVVCGLMIAAGLAKYNTSISKIRRYRGKSGF
ncbi:Asp/Glu/hydantoin racemase [bacterium]|nr:Asp/Glu/hydantoin racemase [bacterium]